MGHKSTMQDLKDVHPVVYHSLQKLLAEDNVSNLGLVFQVSLVVLCKLKFSLVLCIVKLCLVV